VLRDLVTFCFERSDLYHEAGNFSEIQRAIESEVTPENLVRLLTSEDSGF
jgi:hypothetical protein